MTRDEVLAALSRAEVDYVKVQVESKTVWGFGDAEWKSKALRVAAEIIRESGKVAEALGEIVSCEPIDNDPVHKRIKYVEVQIHRTDMDRYRKIVADYFQPAPPAREVENG